ncbi:MAG: hypothetical protein QMC62_02055 [Alteromonadaceae bacterium]|jgi:hypothetical protein
MIKLIAKLKAFKKKLINNKKPILMLLNKQLPKGTGTIIDFSLNKEEHAINIALEKNGSINHINVINYAVHLIDNKTHISWSKIKAYGEYATQLNGLFKQQKSIALPAYLYNLVSRLMNEESKPVTN